MKQIKRCDPRVRRKCPDAGFCKGVFMEGSECDSLQSKLADQGDQREARLIDRQELIKAAQKTQFAIGDNTHPYKAVEIVGKYFRDMVEKAPAVDAVEVVHAKWIHDINNLYGCSTCGQRDVMKVRTKRRFCSYCGAKMDL